MAERCSQIRSERDSPNVTPRQRSSRPVCANAPWKSRTRKRGRGRGNEDAARFNGLPHPARRQGWSGQAEVAPRPESLLRTETNARPELSRVADLNPALVGECRCPVLACFGLIDRGVVGPTRARYARDGWCQGNRKQIRHQRFMTPAVHDTSGSISASAPDAMKRRPAPGGRGGRDRRPIGRLAPRLPRSTARRASRPGLPPRAVPARDGRDGQRHQDQRGRLGDRRRIDLEDLRPVREWMCGPG